MKTLYLLRHAKSDWNSANPTDYQRPLNPRGREAASAMGGYCLSKGIAPGLVLCSSAARTEETLERVMAAAGATWPVESRNDLYLAPTHVMLTLLRALDEDLQSVMMIGHNPGIHDLALRLAKTSAGQEYRALAAKYPTGALTEITLPIDRFADLTPGKGILRRFVRPRDLVSP